MTQFSCESCAQKVEAKAVACYSPVSPEQRLPAAANIEAVLTGRKFCLANRRCWMTLTMRFDFFSHFPHHRIGLYAKAHASAISDPYRDRVWLAYRQRKAFARWYAGG